MTLQVRGVLNHDRAFSRCTLGDASATVVTRSIDLGRER